MIERLRVERTANNNAGAPSNILAMHNPSISFYAAEMSSCAEKQVVRVVGLLRATPSGPARPS